MLCDKCEELRSNKCLNEILKAKRATSCTVKFTLRHYYNEPLLKLFKNSNLQQVWAATILENFMKFSQIVSSIKWNGPIIVMTDSTRLREKLVYAEKLNYIIESTLPHSETSIEVLENIHPQVEI
ncbi:hypothetical protein GLOIN_2v1777971 [Rhizophagus clarus]|uniref:Uncharacterized protein n=1 Tax=Rhizophagus clarus TaxID=94130 RepID=A0A8H3QIJ5_9GLOM|nr:hypothetical protein GLOIN_2v1777971 [Rhizophagus clarus]